MSIINVRQDLALANAEIARLRAEVEGLTRDRDLAERKAAVCREDAEINARRAESAESRVAELEEAIGAWAQAHDGTNFSVQSETSAQLRALLSPRPAPLPDLLAEVLPPKCWHCSYNGKIVVKYCMRDGCPETPKFDVGGTVKFKPKPCATCGGSGVTSAPYELDAEDCPDCRGEGKK